MKKVSESSFELKINLWNTLSKTNNSIQISFILMGQRQLKNECDAKHLVGTRHLNCIYPQIVNLTFHSLNLLLFFSSAVNFPLPFLTAQ